MPQEKTVEETLKRQRWEKRRDTGEVTQNHHTRSQIREVSVVQEKKPVNGSGSVTMYFPVS